jgi:DNA-binding transcriptional MocR family regulator
VAKLLWFYIRDRGEGRYSIRELAESLDLTTAAVQRNLKALVERGLLEVLEPPAGSQAGHLPGRPRRGERGLRTEAPRVMRIAPVLCSCCMRLTVHLPDDLARLLKQAALNEGKSMSALTAEALDFYLRERRRRALGLKVLERAGKGPG